MPDSTSWELVDATGKRRTTGTYDECYAKFQTLANAELQTQTMTTGFTLRRIHGTKAKSRKPMTAKSPGLRVGATL